jgi:hypothetical protein
MDECTSRIRLWIQDDHCMALFDESSPPLIRNIFDDAEMLQALSFSESSQDPSDLD